MSLTQAGLEAGFVKGSDLGDAQAIDRNFAGRHQGNLGNLGQIHFVKS